MLSCSGESGPVRSAGETVQAFYQHLNAGEAAKAQELFGVELADFDQWAAAETKDRTIERVEIIEDTTLRVWARILYEGGLTRCRNIPLEGRKVGLPAEHTCPEARAWAQPGEPTLHKRTKGDMLAVAIAWEGRAVDNNTYNVPGGEDGISGEELTAALVPTYAKRLPVKDDWGADLEFSTTPEGHSYEIRSPGGGGIAIVYANGAWR